MLKPGERLDDLQRNGYKIIQDPGRFCFGMDAVLLSGFARVKTGGARGWIWEPARALSPFFCGAKTEGSYFAGLEIQEESADMARRSVAYNSSGGQRGDCHREISRKQCACSGLLPLTW